MLDIFDILGPVMIGPSSSHTAGAARIGFIARALLGAPPVKAAIHLYGSFAETGCPSPLTRPKRRASPTPLMRSSCGTPTPTPPSSRPGPPTARSW